MFKGNRRGLIVFGLNPVMFVILSIVVMSFLLSLFPGQPILWAIASVLGVFNLFVVFSFAGLPGLAAYLLLIAVLATIRLTVTLGGN